MMYHQKKGTTMKITCLIVASTWMFHAPAMAETELEMNLMSFNIRFGIAYDRENNWPNRQDMVVEMKEKYRPHIIGHQEILPFQSDYLTQQMPRYRWFGAPRNDGALPERSSIMYEWREFIPLDTGTFWISETPEVFDSQSWNTSVARIVTWGRFLHRETQTAFYVYNTHFDHVSQEARLNGMRLILDDIESRTGDLPVIFMGDFNVTAERDEVYHIALDGTGFVDAWTVAEERRGPVATWNAFRPADPNSDRRIDWILLRGPFEVDLCETVTFSRNDRQVSDHFPVFARVRLKLDDAE